MNLGKEKYNNLYAEKKIKKLSNVIMLIINMYQ